MFSVAQAFPVHEELNGLLDRFCLKNNKENEYEIRVWRKKRRFLIYDTKVFQEEHKSVFGQYNLLLFYVKQTDKLLLLP